MQPKSTQYAGYFAFTRYSKRYGAFNLRYWIRPSQIDYDYEDDDEDDLRGYIGLVTDRNRKWNPGFVMPMLATRVQKLPSGPEWEYEVKWDGYRILAVKNGSNVQLFSRRRTNFTDRFQSVTKAVAGIHADSAVLDGEVVAIDARGQPSFQVLQNCGRVSAKAATTNSAGHQLVYYVFDLLFLEGQDLKGRPLAERRAALPKILEHTRVLFSATLEGSLDAILKAVRKHRLEGVVAKRVDSSYEPGRRSVAWQKLPLKAKQEFVVGAYRPDGGTLELILVGHYEDGKLLFTGKVRQGLNPGTRRKLLTILRPLSTGRCPFANLPSSRSGHWGEGVTADEMLDYVWLKPEIVAEIKFTEWTSGGVLRHAEFVGRPWPGGKSFLRPATPVCPSLASIRWSALPSSA